VQIIRKNFGLKILALAIAITGWAYFRVANNPAIAARYDQQLSVPITVANLPVGLVARYVEKEAVVTVAAQRGAPPIRPDEIKAVLDLAYKGPGVYSVPIQMVAPNIVVQSLSPGSVSLTIERVEQRGFPLTLYYTGSPASQIVISKAATMPNSVIVRGATSELTQVTAVRLDVPLAQTPAQLDSMFRPIPVDSLGREVQGVDVAPDLVRVQAQFVKGTGVSKKP
jgi:YbbR domain-containing protein